MPIAAMFRIKSWFIAVLLLLLTFCDCFRISPLFTRGMHGVLRMVSGSRKNETAATPNYAPRSFFSPNFKEEDTMASIRAENWVQDSTFSEGIIPTGAESLARIEHKVNQNVNVKILEASQNAEAAKYFKMVESLAPNDLLMKFAKTAPKNVQEAAKSTIMNILGSLPNYALDAALITTNTKLANLLYQMQMTGYMFKNAEYRMSLTRGLKGLPRLPPITRITTAENVTLALPFETGTHLAGEVTVRAPSGDVLTTTLDVEALTSALSQEIAALRSELMVLRTERENELRANLLTYIQALPEAELMRLTSDMSEEVVQAIELLVDALMDRVGIPSGREKEVVVQQSVGQLAQLCMWQMVCGYKLRELEALEKGAAFN